MPGLKMSTALISMDTHSTMTVMSMITTDISLSTPRALTLLYSKKQKTRKLAGFLLCLAPGALAVAKAPDLSVL
jgi:hypothetical protein